MIKTYHELIQLPTFNERLLYLQLHGSVGADTFGKFRMFNQKFYTSYEWRRFRNSIIVRDYGCDLGVRGCEIPNGTIILIHHIEPITLEDIQLGTDALLNPDNCITVAFHTHNQIHYGIKSQDALPQERTPNDTCPWKR